MSFKARTHQADNRRSETLAEALVLIQREETPQGASPSLLANVSLLCRGLQVLTVRAGNENQVGFRSLFERGFILC